MTSNPNPGSDEAVAQGCTCPVLDNGRGRGAYQIDGVWQFWIDWACPLHMGYERPEDSDEGQDA